jgi:hypothetical protein
MHVEKTRTVRYQKEEEKKHEQSCVSLAYQRSVGGIPQCVAAIFDFFYK